MIGVKHQVVIREEEEDEEEEDKKCEENGILATTESWCGVWLYPPCV
jgi:hypothetical protein